MRVCFASSKIGTIKLTKEHYEDVSMNTDLARSSSSYSPGQVAEVFQNASARLSALGVKRGKASDDTGGIEVSAPKALRVSKPGESDSESDDFLKPMATSNLRLVKRKKIAGDDKPPDDPGSLRRHGTGSLGGKDKAAGGNPKGVNTMKCKKLEKQVMEVNEVTHLIALAF